MYRIVDTYGRILEDSLDYQGVWKWIETENRYTDIRIIPIDPFLDFLRLYRIDFHFFTNELTVAEFAIKHSGKESVATTN